MLLHTLTGGIFFICNEANGETAKDDKWTQIINGMTIYTDTALKAYLEQAGSKHISLPVESVEAAQVYLQIVTKGTPHYTPAEDRTKLEYWLNISRNRWAERLEKLYPSLTNGEKDICYLFVVGLSFDEIASLLGVQSRSVNRVVYRICRKMGIEQGSKDEFVAQIFRLDDCDTNI